MSQKSLFTPVCALSYTNLFWNMHHIKFHPGREDKHTNQITTNQEAGLASPEGLEPPGQLPAFGREVIQPFCCFVSFCF